MLFVAGYFVVDPADREAFLAVRVDAMRETRANEPGCLEYALSADPADETRVMLLERWADQAALDEHLKVLDSKPRSGPAPQRVEVKVYDIAGERSLR